MPRYLIVDSEMLRVVATDIDPVELLHNLHEVCANWLYEPIEELVITGARPELKGIMANLQNLHEEIAGE